MAHVVGVPKRDPCQKCSLPVFLAERLTVGKNVYHRTCLKCARCNSQLTPGSFYETEEDGKYCCETCPDEEKSTDSPISSSSSSPTKSLVAEQRKKFGSPINPDGKDIYRLSSPRSSIADKLSFFENDAKNVLQKNVSDAEKSQSLKKLTSTPIHSYKTNAALTNFISSHFSDTPSTSSQKYEVKSTNVSQQNSTSSSDNEDNDENNDEYDNSDRDDMILPELPKTLPPLANISGSISSKSNDIVINELEILTPTTPMRMSPVKNNQSTFNQESDENPEVTDKHTNLVDLTNSKIQINDRNEQTDTNTNQVMLETKSTSPTRNNDLNVNLNVTKDNIEPDEKMRGNYVEEDTSISQNSIATKMAKNDSRLGMVRARLHQFENISNNDSASIINEHSSNNFSSSNNNCSNICNNSDDNISNKSINHNETSAQTSTEKTLSISMIPKVVETEVPNINDSNSSEDINLKDNYTKDKEDLTRINSSYQHDMLLEKLHEDSHNMYADSIDDTTLYEEHKHKESESVQNKVENEQVKTPISLKNEITKRKESTAKSTFDKEWEIKSTQSKIDSKAEEYPKDLNPFQSDDDDEDSECVNEGHAKTSMPKSEKRKSLNPFDSSDDDEDMESSSQIKVKPSRPPPPKKISTNPFGSESEDEEEERSFTVDSVSSGTPKRTPVPTPRSHVSRSKNSTPEPTPRMTRQTERLNQHHGNRSDYNGSSTSLSTPFSNLKSQNESFNRENETRLSSHSIASSSESSSGHRQRKSRKAPAPPPPITPSTIITSQKLVKELFPHSDADSKKSSPSSSIATTPQPRKKRPAPEPPKKDLILSIDATTLSNSENAIVQSDNVNKESNPETNVETSVNDVVENNFSVPNNDLSIDNSENDISEVENVSITSKQRLIPLDAGLLDDLESNHEFRSMEEENVFYRRTIAPLTLDDGTLSEKMALPDEQNNDNESRQLEKMKDNKEAKNRNRQSQISLSSPNDETDPLYNKSVHGKWKRRKGPAPALPVPPKKVLQMLPLQDIRHELDIIEVQQQGLEKQGVMLEKMIRERCEGGDESKESKEEEINSSGNSKEVEDLILQLFELVNEKNELFRRQAELMYLRRQHRLEQEQADLEYEIRVLMAQPERNKTDSDKAREESLIARLVEVVQLRNEVIDCLEMDRLREAEEDLSIKQRLKMHTAKRDEEPARMPAKLSKKEKKKQKDCKKLGKSKKLDADKDADESEIIGLDKQKAKRKKKKFLF